MTLRVVDLFAGGGGLSLGFQQAGFHVVAAIENWKPAVDVYAANFPQHPVLSLDLADVQTSVREIRQWTPDVLIGGPPCQDFSSAGKRDETLGRASLTVSYAQIIKEYRPQFFLMENVERASKSQAFQKALTIFKGAGYGLTIKVLDASLCGVPQLRKRLIVLGSLHDHDGFLDEALEQGLSIEPMTLRRYFRNRLDFDHYYRHPRSYARRAIFSIDEPSPTIRGVNRPIPKGYPGHAGDTCALQENVRSLTTAERARIQTFPATFKWVGSKTDSEQVIGNAVPVKLAQYVAERFLVYTQERMADNAQHHEPVMRYQLFDKAAEIQLHKLKQKSKTKRTTAVATA
jgi:DNA (cytosine-5)-methyltransferase 1